MKKSLFISIALFGLLLITGGFVSAQDYGFTTLGEEQESRGLLPIIRPIGQTARYVIPYFMSSNVGLGSRSVTAIAVYNQTDKDCVVAVHFQYGAQTVDTCVITDTVKPGRTTGFCTRTVDNSAYLCKAMPVCNPELIGIVGHAFITSNSACANIAVDAHIIYTSDTDDKWVSGIAPLRVVKMNKANQGD